MKTPIKKTGNKTGLWAVLFASLLSEAHAQPPKSAQPQPPKVVPAPSEEPPPPRDADPTEIEELKRLEASLQQRLLAEPSAITPQDFSAYEGAAPTRDGASRSGSLRRDDFTTDSAPKVSPKKAAPQDATLVDLATLQPLDIEYTHDPMIDAYVQFFLTKGRGFMRRALEKQAKYAPMMEKIFLEEGVPLDLYGIGVIESGYNPKAYSYAAASGIWQFIPSTGRYYGMRSDSWVDERRDPEQETRAAAKLFKELYKQFGTWELAFAAYNGGPGTVTKNCRHYNTNNFWEMASLGGFPDQTRFYVPKAIAAAIVLKNAKALGFTDLKQEPLWEYDLAHLPSGQLSTALLAKAAGIDEPTLLEYNPELLRGFTPPETPEYLLRLPKGKGAAFTAALSNVWPQSRVTFGRHIVRQGEKLDEIARYYGVSSSTLQGLNNLTPGTPLVGGAPLLVPLAFAKEPRTGSGFEESEVLTAAFPAEFSYPNRKVVYYRARSKDTIENLALAFEVEAQEIALWNGLDPSANLISGMVVRFYVPSEFEPSKVILLDPVKVKAVVRTAGLDARGSSLLLPEQKYKKKPVKKKPVKKKKH